jgi:allantoinase
MPASNKAPYDLLLRNVKLVRPGVNEVPVVDIAVRGEKIAAIGSGLDGSQAGAVMEGHGQLAFPGVVDAHMHTGIYSPLQDDALTESRAAAQGGVTSSLNYFRSGQYYLNEGGPYSRLFPRVLELSADRFFVDYAYHLAPIDSHHITEMESLIETHGVTSFKIFMFYGGYGLHGASGQQREFLMIGKDENYDIAHFEFVMRGAQRAMERFPQLRREISVSLHCETAEILNAYTRIVAQDPSLSGLRAYSAARPPHSEGLAVCIAAYLAHETNCVNINLLHLSSRKAVEAAVTMAQAFPHIDFRREVTIGHLVLDYDSPAAALAKVNPPIRSREDVEYLWGALLDGKLDWVCSDHACCKHELKVPAGSGKDIFLAKAGFGGTEYLLPALITAGRPRGLSLNRIAELTARNPARRFGLRAKGDIAVGMDADIALVDPSRSQVIHAADSLSAQGYTPFEGFELTAQVTTTILRGNVIYENGAVKGKPLGRYLRRPYGAAEAGDGAA